MAPFQASHLAAPNLTSPIAINSATRANYRACRQIALVGGKKINKQVKKIIAHKEKRLYWGTDTACVKGKILLWKFWKEISWRNTKLLYKQHFSHFVPSSMSLHYVCYFELFTHSYISISIFQTLIHHNNVTLTAGGLKWFGVRSLNSTNPDQKEWFWIRTITIYKSLCLYALTAVIIRLNVKIFSLIYHKSGWKNFYRKILYFLIVVFVKLSLF